MASIFRSEEMTLCQIFLSTEAAFNSLSLLGEIGLVEFKDLNTKVNVFQRRFVADIRRCDEMERKLKFFETQLKKAEIEIFDDDENPPAPQPSEIVDIEIVLEKMDNELKEVNSYTTTLKKNELELIELKHVLQTMEKFCGGFDLDTTTAITQNLIPMEEAKENLDLVYVTGVIKRIKLPVLERMLWRVCRGNAYMRTSEIEQPLEDPVTGDMDNKVCFIIFVQGELLRSKINRICEASKATLYHCPERNEDRIETLKGVKTRITDVQVIIQHTTGHRDILLTKTAKAFRIWLIKVRKLKGIYHILNMFSVDVTAKCFIAEAWIPTNDIGQISNALHKATKMSGSSVEPIITSLETEENPPTFHKVNKFTKAFQKLIDSYGVATYREVNPGLYTTTTFPFLFAVMFGDAGHGTIMAGFALWMCIFEKKLIAMKSKNEIWNMIFSGRYIVLLMGLFSIYTGAVYNDMYSKSLAVFPSHFHVGSNATDAVILYHEPEYMLDPGDVEDYEGDPYPFGIDPIWQLSLNKINFLNSYKMKASIIIGVLHMIFGICLSTVNHIHYKRYINLIFDFLPQLILLTGIFGYLCFLCVYKYFVYGAGEDFGFDFDHDTRCAPSILILFIDMFLFKFEQVPDPKEPEDLTCSTAYMYGSQYNLQKIILLVSILMVPLMLFPKPYILNKRVQKARLLKKEAKQALLAAAAEIDTVEPGQSNESHPMSTLEPKASSSKDGEEKDGEEKAIKINIPRKAPPPEEEYEEPGSEIFLHQAIHTIEFTLGCVSHTASYLRLWALSLAHAQLSEVLWMMVLSIGLKQSSATGAIVLFAIFSFWAVLTISILIVMEGLSAFLHTLRLHWVEFCSKFYEREGYLFYPFKFKHFVYADDSI